MAYDYDDELDEYTNALLEHNERIWASIRLEEREIQLANDLYERSAE